MRRFLMVLALAAVASPAVAQPTPWSPERITAGWVFTPSIVFGGLWDSNVTLRNEVNPTFAETVGLLNPRGEIDFNSRRAKFNAGYSGTLEAYRNIEELTRYDQRGRLEARYQMTPRLLFQTRQQLTLTPTTDQLELGGLPYTRVGSRMFDARGGFVYELTPRTKLTADYNVQWVNFDRASELAPDFRFLRGGYSYSPAAEVKYAVSRRLGIGAAYNFRHTSLDGDEHVVDSQEVVGVVDFELGPTTMLHGKGGVAHGASRDGDTQTGPSFGAGISHTAGRVTMGANYERTFIPSFGFGNLTASQVFHTGVSVPLAHGRMFTSGGFTWRRSDPLLSQGLNIQLDSYWVNASLGYHIARWLRMEGFYRLTHQGSSAQGNVNRTRIGVQFVTSKPVRIQ
jgi:hypothetical protein